MCRFFSLLCNLLNRGKDKDMMIILSCGCFLEE